MAKKVNAKDLREKNKAQRQNAYKKAEEEKTLQKQAQEKEAEKVEPAAAKKELKKPKTKKTASKRAGMKSAFVLGKGKVLLTSFGKGNKAVVEKLIEGDTVKSIQNPESYDAKKKDRNFSIEKKLGGEKITGLPTNPLQTNAEVIRASAFQKGRTAGKDMIGIKSFLENKYFGKEFEDNIHIQIAYSIMDIEKILAPHLNNIVYTIDNLFRRETLEDREDFQGYMGLRNTYETFLSEKMEEGLPEKEEKRRKNEIEKRAQFETLMKSPCRQYLGKALWGKSRIIDDIYSTDEEIRKELERYYYELCLIGMSRQSLFHGESYDGKLFTLDAEYDDETAKDARVAARAVLDELFKEAVNRINKDFYDNAGHDIAALFEIFKEEDRGRLTREYYDFIVFRQQKNTGFSIRQLREAMLSCEGALLAGLEPETGMRKKFYRNVDFLICRYYQGHAPQADQMVESLRFFAKNDEEKEDLYRKEGEALWKALGADIEDRIYPLSSAVSFASVKAIGKKDIEAYVSGHTIETSASYFTKLIFMFTLFVNGKEINDILTQLLSKFENIAAFVSVLRAQGLDTSFTETFKIFEGDSAQKIADELRLVNNIARQANADDTIPFVAYSEALQVLGFSGTKEDIENYVEYIRCKDLDEADADNEKAQWRDKIGELIRGIESKKIAEAAGNIVRTTYDLKDGFGYDKHIENLIRIAKREGADDDSAKKIAKYISSKDGSLKGKYRKALSNAQCKLPDQGFRNFIINNVIQSKNFLYLVRFGNPAKVSSLIKNTEVVKFVLSEISPDQILRYYNSITGNSEKLETDERLLSAQMKKMRGQLLLDVQKVSFETFVSVLQGADATETVLTREAEAKDKAMKIIGLYLAVLYLASKNLVNINARYCMAFHKVERDYKAVTGAKFDGEKLCHITEFSVRDDAPRLNKRACCYLKEDLKVKNDDLIVMYRNSVAHLNAIRDFSLYAEGIRNITSYYALYQYVMQKFLISASAANKKTKNLFEAAPYSGYKERLEKYGNFSADFVKILNVPFGYNLPRYKNLSCEGLFDMNRPGAGKKDEN